VDLKFHTFSSNSLPHNTLAWSASSSGTAHAIHWLVLGDGLWRVLPAEATAPGSCMALQTGSHTSGLYWPSDIQMGAPLQSSCSCSQQTPTQRDPAF